MISRTSSARSRLLAFAAALTVILAPGGPAKSHPHVWIDMTVSSIFNEDGELTGLRHIWAFDEFYTVFQLEDFGVSDGTSPSDSQLAGYASDLLTNIAEYGYLMRVEGKDGRLELKGHSESARLRPDNRLEITFTVDAPAPIDLTDWPVSYSVFDPQYFIEMLHEKDTGVLMTGSPPSTCTSDLQRPNPTFEMISLAASLDRLETGPDTLGAMFAETVVIDCRAEKDRETN
ncbi:DUF1007 family protein [Pyruvatibacter sp.]|uniref:DUF1007 family protein n=1 Tax=Pyruvatibacter sp. TaxID=1981328 RepID=UPI0032EBE908